jgi:hypothetical protein
MNWKLDRPVNICNLKILAAVISLVVEISLFYLTYRHSGTCSQWKDDEPSIFLSRKLWYLG